MTDKEQSQLLEKFINDSPLATEIQVTVTEHSKSFKPRYDDAKARYEDANLLASILVGAENFLYFLRRNGYKISKKHQNGGIMTHKSPNSPRKGAKMSDKCTNCNGDGQKKAEGVWCDCPVCEGSGKVGKK